MIVLHLILLPALIALGGVYGSISLIRQSNNHYVSEQRTLNKWTPWFHRLEPFARTNLMRSPVMRMQELMAINRIREELLPVALCIWDAGGYLRYDYHADRTGSIEYQGYWGRPRLWSPSDAILRAHHDRRATTRLTRDGYREIAFPISMGTRGRGGISIIVPVHREIPSA